jgi:hypothetical protein
MLSDSHSWNLTRVHFTAWVPLCTLKLNALSGLCIWKPVTLSNIYSIIRERLKIAEKDRGIVQSFPQHKSTQKIRVREHSAFASSKVNYYAVQSALSDSRTLPTSSCALELSGYFGSDSSSSAPRWRVACRRPSNAPLIRSRSPMRKRSAAIHALRCSVGFLQTGSSGITTFPGH